METILEKTNLGVDIVNNMLMKKKLEKANLEVGVRLGRIFLGEIIVRIFLVTVEVTAE